MRIPAARIIRMLTHGGGRTKAFRTNRRRGRYNLPVTTPAKVPAVNMVESRVRVRYAETDQMGVVYHANYLIWFEVGRVEYIRQLGLDYRSMEREEGCGI